jgi:hypothetical protein
MPFEMKLEFLFQKKKERNWSEDEEADGGVIE